MRQTTNTTTTTNFLHESEAVAKIGGAKMLSKENAKNVSCAWRRMNETPNESPPRFV